MHFTRYFANQFLFSSKKIPELDQHWNKRIFHSYNLYTHPGLHICESKTKAFEIILIGDVYDYENTNASNKDILDKAIEPDNTLKSLIESFDKKYRKCNVSI